MKTSLIKSILFALSIAVVFALSGCGDGGSGGSSTEGSVTPLASVKITGTVATGKAIAGATITLKDSAGRSSNATTATNGTFTLNTTGFTPPFILQATNTGTVGTLYSVSADSKVSTTINVTQLTDIITRSWYNIQGVATDTAFSTLASNPAPLPVAVQSISNTVQNMMQLWLDNANVPATTNLISTPFVANSTGIDLVLDHIKNYTPPAPTGTAAFSITDGTITQTTNLSYSTSTGAISLAINTAASGLTGTSNHTSSSVVPVTTVQQTALDGINTTLNSFINTINTKGSALTYSDLLQFLDPTLINDGLNQTEVAKGLATVALASRFIGQIPTYSVKMIKSLDTTNNVAEVVIDGIGTVTFRKDSSTGKWLISGNGRVAIIVITAVMNTRQGINDCAGICDGTKMTARVDAPQGTVTNVTITGGGIWNATNIPKSNVVVGTGINLDRFWLDSNHLASFPVKDTPFQVQITTATGTNSYTILSNAYTTEAISVTNLTGSTIDVAKLGSPLTVNWTKPVTFPISRMGLSYQAFTGLRSDPATFVCTAAGYMSDATLPSATVTIPTTCNANPVVSVNLDVWVIGVNGESTTVTYVIN